MTAPLPGLDGLGIDGLRTDQAPPLSIPAGFFLVAPVAMVAGGGLLVLEAFGVAGNRLNPLAFSSTHVATLGFLGSLMLGALYQMIPVVAGAPVPRARLAHAVQAIWIGGVVALVTALATGGPRAFRIAEGLLALALLVFLVPVAIALVRAPTRTETVHGMRLALAGFLAVATLGVGMAEARASGRLYGGGDWMSWLAAHATLGGLVWIGGLIVAVSWQVVPMFYLTDPLPTWSRRVTLAAVALALVGAPTAVFTGQSPRVVALVAAPAAVAIWLVHPIVTVRAIRKRRRRRVDASARFWVAGLACAPFVLAAAVGTTFLDDPRWPVALGWIGLWGWAALIAHGMASRIVPFLVWFHRFSSLVGIVPVPTMRQLLPELRVRVALWLHGSAVVAGVVAIALQLPWLVRIAGVLLAAAGALFATNLVHVLARVRKAPLPPGDGLG